MQLEKNIQLTNNYWYIMMHVDVIYINHKLNNFTIIRLEIINIPLLSVYYHSVTFYKYHYHLVKDWFESRHTLFLAHSKQHLESL